MTPRERHMRAGIERSVDVRSGRLDAEEGAAWVAYDAHVERRGVGGPRYTTASVRLLARFERVAARAHAASPNPVDGERHDLRIRALRSWKTLL